jgi:hypothetical protein
MAFALAVRHARMMFPTHVLVAIVRNRMSLDLSLYQILQILNVFSPEFPFSPVESEFFQS